MLRGYRIALVEDDEIMGASLLQRLEIEGAEVVWLKQAGRAVGALRTPRAPIDAVICDIRLPDGDGEDLFNTLNRTSTPPPFLFITGHGGIGQAVRLIQAGAVDYVTKPFDMADFLDRLALLLSSARPLELPPVLGISAAARRVDALAAKAARTDRAVLVRGGPGTGKGLVARRVHEASDRRAAPFVTVNLAREADAAAALFAPDGALARTGEGTLFLQSVDRLAAPDLARLLAALAGGSDGKSDGGFTGRLIASCGEEMDAIRARDGARADLLDLLDMTEIPVPPLRERPEDAVWLMNQLFDRANARRAQPLQGIGRLTEEAVRLHDWPGNGREVRARLVHGIDIAAGDVLQPVDLFPERLTATDPVLTLAAARDRAEKEQIIRALEQTGGRVGAAAKLLKVSRTTLWERMQKFGFTGDPG